MRDAMRTATALMGMLALLTSCGGDSDPARNAPNSPVISYRLTPAQGPIDVNGSRIGFVPPVVPPALPVPLSGTFDVIASEPVPGNTRFVLSITRVEFTGGPYVISGNTGYITATTLNLEQPLSIAITASINGEQIELTGTGSLKTFTSDSPPSFRGVELLGKGYGITIFAEPAT